MKKILIIEDQPEIRLLLRATLEADDCEIAEARNAQEGWDEALRSRPDLVLLDIMMPGGIDGLELCRRLKADPATREIKVILVSARGHRNDMKIGREAGADDYLLKPFSPQRLQESVERLLVSA
jgi:CheY-like chemotaxis protein